MIDFKPLIMQLSSNSPIAVSTTMLVVYGTYTLSYSIIAVRLSKTLYVIVKS